MMNLEHEDNSAFHGIRPVERKIWKVVKPLKPEQELKNIAQTEILEQERGFTVFRMKRKAEIEPFDLLVIDNVEIASVRKKLQTHNIDQLEKTMETLTIQNPSKEIVEEQVERNKFLESLTFFEGNEKLPSDMTYVLKRIDTSNIFELGEEEFRKYYRTVYNETRLKEKREANISGRRKDLMDNFLKEKNAKNQLQLYDVNLRPGKETLLCNGQPMIQTNIMEMAKKKKMGDMEEEDAEYDIFYLGKAPKARLTDAPNITLDAPLQSTVQRDLDENDLDDGELSEEEEGVVAKYNDDNYDSNAEEHDYPDEEAEGLDDYGKNYDDEDHFGDDGSDEESNMGDYDEDNEDDERYEFEKDEQELARRENFYNDIHVYNNPNYKWPGKKNRDEIEEEK